MILPPPAGIRASIPENYTMYGEDAGEGGAGGDFGMAYAKRQYTNPQSGVPFQWAKRQEHENAEMRLKYL